MTLGEVPGEVELTPEQAEEMDLRNIRALCVDRSLAYYAPRQNISSPKGVMEMAEAIRAFIMEGKV